MTDFYVSKEKIVLAWSEAQDGVPGYTVRHPMNTISWYSREQFLNEFRGMTIAEKQLLGVAPIVEQGKR